jgi:hypothetical protein
MNPADDAAVIGVAGLDKNGALAPVLSKGKGGNGKPHGAGRAGVDLLVSTLPSPTHSLNHFPLLLIVVFARVHAMGGIARRRPRGRRYS